MEAKGFEGQTHNSFIYSHEHTNVMSHVKLKYTVRSSITSKIKKWGEKKKKIKYFTQNYTVNKQVEGIKRQLENLSVVHTRFLFSMSCLISIIIYLPRVASIVGYEKKKKKNIYI